MKPMGKKGGKKANRGMYGVDLPPVAPLPRVHTPKPPTPTIHCRNNITYSPTINISAPTTQESIDELHKALNRHTADLVRALKTGVYVPAWLGNR